MPPDLQRTSPPRNFLLPKKWPHDLSAWCGFLLVGFMSLCVIYFGPGPRVGDGSEYLLMLISLAEQGTPYATDTSGTLYDQWAANHWAAGTFPPYDHLKNGYFRKLMNQHGEVDTFHFWFYSLLAVPFYWPLKLAGLNIELSFALLHLVLLSAAVVSARKKFGTIGIVSLTFIIFGPPLWFVNKVHTEFFTVIVTTIGCMHFLKKSHGKSGVWFALASTQNPPFALVGLTVLGLGLAKQGWHFVRTNRILIACCFVLMGLHPIYYLARHGTITPTLLIGFANFSSLFPSWKLLTCHLVDPDIGLFANWVSAAPLLAFASVLLIRRDLVVARKTAIFFGLSILILAWSQARNETNVNHGGTVDLSRYALWYLFVFFAIVVGVGQWIYRQPVTRRILLSGFGVILALVSAWQYSPSLPETYMRPTMLSSLLYEHVPWLYDPLPEIFYERRARGREVLASRLPTFAVSNPSGSKILVARTDVKYRSSAEIPAIPGSPHLDPVSVYVTAAEKFRADPHLDVFYLNGRSSEFQRRWPALPHGETVPFTKGGPGSKYLVTGWSVPERWGIWSDGPEATLSFYVENLLFRGEYELTLRSLGFIPPGASERRVTVFLNNHLLAHEAIKVDINSGSAKVLRYRFGGTMLRPGNRLRFLIDQPGPGGPNDGRRLGIGLLSMRLDLVSEAPPPLLAGSEAVSFTDSGGGQQYLFGGWSAPEKWGTWSNGPEATLTFSLKPMEFDREYELTLSVVGYIPPSGSARRVTILLNEQLLGDERLNARNGSQAPEILRYRVRGPTFRPRNILRFVIENPRQPTPDDGRQLGIGLVSMTIRKRPA